MTNIQQEVINGNINPYELLDLWNEKPLDQSDIESLGWIKHAINNNCYYLELHKNTFGTIYMEYYDEQQTKWCIESDRHGESIFIGTIKNKSELIKLMQQLNIK